MGVGYFDRPDNKGAKAGNLNHALELTSAPYVVTLDADMIVRSDFLLKTIPYFVDAEHRAAQLPEDKRKHLALLQTPQAFYDPDVFQHALYAELQRPTRMAVQPPIKGVATVLNEHSMRVFLDEAEGLGLGNNVGVCVETGRYRADMSGVIVGMTQMRKSDALVYNLELLDYGNSELEYLQILYDRIPSLPQVLKYDFGMLGDLWRNIAFRVARTVQ